MEEPPGGAKASVRKEAEDKELPPLKQQKLADSSGVDAPKSSAVQEAASMSSTSADEAKNGRSSSSSSSSQGEKGREKLSKYYCAFELRSIVPTT